jgi:hypothetical protein
MATNTIFRRGDIYVAVAKDTGRWAYASGPAFPTFTDVADGTLPRPHDGSSFFRTDLGAWYVWDEPTAAWVIVGGGAGAPAAAQYIVAAADPDLTAERVATDTPTVTWDFATPAQAKAAALAVVSGGVSGGNTLGNTGIGTGSLVLLGGNNVTLSQVTAAGARTVVVSAATQSVQPEGTISLGMSNLGNTSGTTGIVSDTGIRYLFAGGNNITLSQSLNGLSGTLTISAFNQSVQALGTQSLAMNTSTAGGATGGTSGSATGTGIQYVFHAGSNITLSQSLNGASGSMSIYGPAAGAAVLNFSAGTTSGNIGSVVFSDSNQVSFGLNGSTITAKHALNFSGGTTSQNISDQLIFSNSNNVSFGLNGSTITASASRPSMSFWENLRAANLNANTAQQSALSFQRFHIPLQMTATQINFLGYMTGSSAAASGGITVSAAVYTMTGSTANSLWSGNFNITWTSGSDTSASSFWGGQSGTRWRTGTINSWSLTPGDYLFGCIIVTGTSQTAHTWTFYGGSSVSVNDMPGGGNYLKNFQYGSYSANTGAFPSAVTISQISQTAARALNQPWFALAGSF